MSDVQRLPLQVENLVKHFGDLTAVAGVSLDLRNGECLGLLGPNGAGKSTLIRSIVGRVRPDSGTITVFGEPATSAAARKVVGWIPQDLALYPLLTCEENLRSFGEYQGLRGKDLANAIQWCLDWAALTDRAREPVKKLSGGMKRRLNMAAGMIHRPRLMLMDEPTVGVDPQSRNRIFEMIEALHHDGMSIIYTTHYIEEAERLCDRIAIMDHGSVITTGTKEELVRAAFGGRSDVIMRFASDGDRASAWAIARGGKFEGETARFAVDDPAKIAALLDAANQEKLEILDVVLRRPNLESVFLQLTGRELRD
ncbi:MAG: ABC transporter ATP-binding protein [Acidobacteriales bacterium]|nr:ABC transporter ATP-binding protein [Terriglobales bacterium]